MKFLENENIEKGVVDYLRQTGFDVFWCTEAKSRLSDIMVLHIAGAQRRIIITNDKDFGELTYLQRQTKHGIILLRFHSEDTQFKISVVKSVIDEYSIKLPKHFTVISENKVRIRPL